MDQSVQRSNASIWVQAIRPFAYSASIIPVLVGAMAALKYPPVGGHISWILMPIIVIASVLFHTGTNLVSEYFDLIKGVDRPDSFGSSRVLVDNLLLPRKVLNAGLACFAVGFALGLILVSYQGINMLYIGVIGLIGGLFYTGKPFGYKYIALGDILVFALMGPMMVIGAYFALTGVYNPNVLYISIPIGLLVAAILHANNTRDIAHDKLANVKTLAMLLGLKGAKFEYYLLVIGAYISVGIMVFLKVLSPWTLIVLISLPPALKNIMEISKAEESNPSKIAMMDVKTAQHHMLFGLLYSIGILVSNFY